MKKIYTYERKAGISLNGMGNSSSFEIESLDGSLKSGADDVSENQLNTFHVELNTQNINNLKPIKVKKFEVIWKNSMEFLFAENLTEAQKMFKRLYPGFSAVIQEASI
jgi:hypothetical protein